MAQTKTPGFSDMTPEQKEQFKKDMKIIEDNMRPVQSIKNQMMHEGYKQAKTIYLSF